MKGLGVCLLALTLGLIASDTELCGQVAQTGGGSAAGSATAPLAPDVFGYFSIKGKAPRGFADIDHLNLGGSGEYGVAANPPYYGMIRLTNRARTDYKLLKPVINGNSLSFKTKAVGGVSYVFDGILARTDFGGKSQPEPDDIVLSGTLKKIKAGKVVAQGKMNFTWQIGD